MVDAVGDAEGDAGTKPADEVPCYRTAGTIGSTTGGAARGAASAGAYCVAEEDGLDGVSDVASDAPEDVNCRVRVGDRVGLPLAVGHPLPNLETQRWAAGD